MPVKLRLRRAGRTHAAYYQLVAADSRSPRDGRFIEKIGTYNPLTQPAEIWVDREKAMKWMRDGAQPTDTVRAILRHEGILLQLHMERKGRNTDDIRSEYHKFHDAKYKKLVESVSKLEGFAKLQADRILKAEQQKRAALDPQLAPVAAAPSVAPAPEPVAVAESVDETAAEETAAE
jgi:small subunit ribosomal protein S16